MNWSCRNHCKSDCAQGLQISRPLLLMPSQHLCYYLTGKTNVVLSDFQIDKCLCFRRKPTCGSLRKTCIPTTCTNPTLSGPATTFCLFCNITATYHGLERNFFSSWVCTVACMWTPRFLNREQSEFSNNLCNKISPMTTVLDRVKVYLYARTTRAIWNALAINAKRLNRNF